MASNRDTSSEGEDVISSVELSVGQTNVSIQGSEDFIEKQLPDLLDWASNTSESAQSVGSTEDSAAPSNERGEEVQGKLPVVADQGVEDDGQKDQTSEDGLDRIAREINVDPENLREHFYIDEEGVHIQNPMEIDPQYALLGYCTLQEQLTGETYHDNRETKQTLIDQEKIDISGWGSNLLYQLRRNGLVKDDPNTDRSRNKPFKVTPKGHQEFVTWVDQQD